MSRKVPAVDHCVHIITRRYKKISFENGVNGRDTVFVRCVSECASVHSGLVNAYSSKMVKATDFKFDMHVPRDSPDMTTPKIFRNWGIARVT